MIFIFLLWIMFMVFTIWMFGDDLLNLYDKYLEIKNRRDRK